MKDPTAALILRYVAYVVFALVALIFWAWYALFVLGIFPVPAEPACVVYGTPCPEPSMLVRILQTASVWLAIPITVVIFIFLPTLHSTAFGLQRLNQ